MYTKLSIHLIFVVLVHNATALQVCGADQRQISAAELADKIKGGLVGQILGNLNGLPHEMKYIAEPGSVADYTPALPEGARTDDDTDLEWLYVCEIQKTRQPLTPPQRIVQLWQNHVNEGIWCANRYARDLMDLGFEPPWTGRVALNPWAEFNLSGQFLCESFGLMSPGLPQTASRLGVHHTQVAVDQEPLQTTQFFATIIACAFFESDLDTLLDLGLQAVDADSRTAAVVRQARLICQQHPSDWRAARQAFKDQWQIHNGGVRDWNGYELNTACTIAALYYGQGNLRDTLQLAFNLGWDCDNNAATAATIIGVLKGNRWIEAQQWNIKDRYRNTTRRGMPTEETISTFSARIVACAELILLQHGGTLLEIDGVPSYHIPAEPPRNILPLAAPELRKAELLQLLSANEKQNLTGAETERARIAYLAICLGQSQRLAVEYPAAWAAALGSLRKQTAVLKNIQEAPLPSGEAIQQAFATSGLN
ncbi:MAG: ADP-ribosylglycohydrolase family protein [Planctomycetales bacterium]|nr:ADP-ribosylglycohydrolase family protein [Planctomycetales bacterium]